MRARLVLAVVAAAGQLALLGGALAQGTVRPPATPNAPRNDAGNPPVGSVPVESWVPRTTAEVTGLDKVRAQSTPLTIPVGQSVTYHSLTITVRSCFVRPSDAAPDATAFLEIKDSTAGAPGFRGWMVASVPSVSMLQHPIYDLRVTGCR